MTTTYQQQMNRSLRSHINIYYTYICTKQTCFIKLVTKGAILLQTCCLVPCQVTKKVLLAFVHICSWIFILTTFSHTYVLSFPMIWIYIYIYAPNYHASFSILKTNNGAMSAIFGGYVNCNTLAFEIIQLFAK